jgi:hypothetical protein
MSDIKHALLVVSVVAVRFEATIGRQRALEEHAAYFKI